MMDKWITVADININSGSYSLARFLEMVKRLIPAGTKDEDIHLEFDVYTNHDNTILESFVRVNVRDKDL